MISTTPGQVSGCEKCSSTWIGWYCKHCSTTCSPFKITVNMGLSGESDKAIDLDVDFVNNKDMIKSWLQAHSYIPPMRTIKEIVSADHSKDSIDLDVEEIIWPHRDVGLRCILGLKSHMEYFKDLHFASKLAKKGMKIVCDGDGSNCRIFKVLYMCAPTDTSIIILVPEGEIELSWQPPLFTFLLVNSLSTVVFNSYEYEPLDDMEWDPSAFFNHVDFATGRSVIMSQSVQPA